MQVTECAPRLCVTKKRLPHKMLTLSNFFGGGAAGGGCRNWLRV